MTYYDYFMPPVDESLRELVDVGFNSPGLWIEKVGHQPTSQYTNRKTRVSYAIFSGIGCGVHYVLTRMHNKENFGRIFSVDEVRILGGRLIVGTRRIGRYFNFWRRRVR